jgi:diadenylate cyclase
MEASLQTRSFSAPGAPANPRPQLRVLKDDEQSPATSDSLTIAVVSHALAIARETQADAIVLPADVVQRIPPLVELLPAAAARIILFSRGTVAPPAAAEISERVRRIAIPHVPMNRAGQIKAAILVSLAQGILARTDRVICVAGLDGAPSLDACLVLELNSEPELFTAADTILLGGDVSPTVFERTLLIASQLASEGREGRPIGALFVVGDSQYVLEQSRPLVLNPFHGYPESERNILDPNLQETIKEFSAIDGAFIIRGDGVVLSAGRQLLPPSTGAQLMNGLGTRHAAACAMTAASTAVAIVISQSTGMISIFKGGTMMTCIQRPTMTPRHLD